MLDSESDFVALDKPCIIVKTNEILVLSAQHQDIARYYIPARPIRALPRGARKQISQIWRSVVGSIVDHCNPQRAVRLILCAFDRLPENPGQVGYGNSNDNRGNSGVCHLVRPSDVANAAKSAAKRSYQSGAALRGTVDDPKHLP